MTINPDRPSLLAPGGLLYGLLHLRLIDHHPEEKDREWWARCRLEHVCITPYLAYDLLRVAIGSAIFATFMPAAFVIAMILTGLAVTVGQIAIDRRRRMQVHSHGETFVLVKRLVLLRTLQWGIFTSIALYSAPPELLVGLVPVAVMIMWIEAIALIAIPKGAVLNAAIHGLAIAVPLSMSGDIAKVGAALVAIASFFALHWLVFHLHYMFATRRLRTRSLTEANDTIQLLLNQYDLDGSDWLFECSEDGKILRPSPRFCEAAGRSAEELEGLRLLSLFEDSPEREKLRAMGGQDGNFHRLAVPLMVDGERRWWSISARKVRSNNGKWAYWRGFVADTTRARAAEAKVQYMAHYDVLTDLPNRALFNSTVKRAFDRYTAGDTIAVVCVDLDRFKEINDTFGHPGGDEALRIAGRRIEACVPSGAMVARLGGDEFAVLLENLDSHEQGTAWANAIVEAMNAPATIAGRSADIGASVGIAFVAGDHKSADEVVQAADLALYDAKTRGRKSASQFDRDMQERMQERRQLEIDLRDALMRGELELYYQSLVDTQSLEVVGYEALLRWHHPQRGLIGPDVFVPIAEETGQIVSIGAWVLREALEEASHWPEHISVSVNLSPVQAASKDIFSTIVHALATSGVPAHRLELEITESVLLRDGEDTIALLHKIRALGVRIALDDFGMGYSSLNYLRSFPFDKIKIDRCFVRDMIAREDNTAIVQAVIALATRLNMRTTAEGVENAEQMERLQATECSQMQGFLFSRPVPAATLGHREAKAGPTTAPEKLARDTTGSKAGGRVPSQRKVG